VTPPLSLYVHLPWCVRKCPYCDFNSHTAGETADKRRYVKALVEDIRREALRAGERLVETVFFGGGTPSFFSAGEIAAVLEEVAASLNLASDAEITMEANPGTVERGCLADYRRAGINRLSLGAQSFSDDSLHRLGRIHGADEILIAWKDAEKAGFDSINLDLMYALPGQSVEMALYDLERAVALSPQHLSWYQLTLEPNTVFHAKPPADLPDDDQTWQIEERGHELLRRFDYEHYETSAFARAGFACRHNLNYWRFGDYLAVGAGAHGKYSDGNGDVWRYRKPAHPSSYMQASEAGQPLPPMRRLAAGELSFEFMLNALRLTRGFAADDFVSRTGLPFEVVAPRMARAVSLGLMIAAIGDGGRAVFRPTQHGRRFQNDLQALFLPEPACAGRELAAGRAG
jgi:oxygen-independent coproporphyrinogen-3 oxidase